MSQCIFGGKSAHEVHFFCHTRGSAFCTVFQLKPFLVFLELNSDSISIGFFEGASDAIWVVLIMVYWLRGKKESRKHRKNLYFMQINAEY